VPKARAGKTQDIDYQYYMGIRFRSGGRCRVNQVWSGVDVIVTPMEFQELPPLGEPRHVEGSLTAWII